MSSTRMQDSTTREHVAAEPERPISEIVGELWAKTEVLVRQEVQLARAQLGERGNALKDELKVAATAGAMLYVGVLSLTAAVILLLSEWLEPWLSAFIVGASASVLGYVLGRREPQRIAAVVTGDELPQRTEQTHSVAQARR